MTPPMKQSKNIVIKWLVISDFKTGQLMKLLSEADPCLEDGNSVYEFKRKVVKVNGNCYNQVKLKVSSNLGGLLDYIEDRVETL